MWKQLARNILVVRDEAIVEDGHCLILIKYRVRLSFAHGVFA